jgi:hypothetical protein
LNSSDITGVIKSWRTRWFGHVACMGYEKCILKPEEIYRLTDFVRRRWENNIKLDVEETTLEYE